MIPRIRHGRKDMDDLLKEFEDLLDQGFDNLLDIVREIEGRPEPEFRAKVRKSSRTYVDRDAQSDWVNQQPDHSSTANRSNTNQATADAESSTTDNVIVTPPSADSVPPVSLDGVGGLSQVVRELRELVELPLKRPDLLAMLGLEPTTGVLLVGPPGTGKTLTARALAEELGVNYIAIVGPEVMGKYYGEAEARLRSIFQKASRSAPCIVFIDEIDSLAPIAPKWKARLKNAWLPNF